LSERNFSRVLDLLERKRIRHLWGNPPSVNFLARRVSRGGWNAPLDTVVTWGDNLYKPYRTKIEAAFQTKVFDTYGCAEGFQIAAQCGTGQNYHVHELDVIVEILDDEGLPVAPGEAGNVVVTRLHPGPMPLIRYQVGDIAVRGAREQCPCGRVWEQFGGIHGRDTDVVFTPSGARLNGHFFAALMEHFPEIAFVQVVQEALSSVVVNVVLAADFHAPANWRGKALSVLKESGAQDLRIEIEIVDEIPRCASGKRLLVVNKLLTEVNIGSPSYATAKA
jgi:phenylacetate-CoA ligase